MIKSIEIQNFQSHKDTKLEFDPGVNIIIGDSDAGKTVILRALRWLVWNRPSGDSFRSNWGGETTVQVELDNGQITRVKDKNTNKYWYGDTQLEAFGVDVPDVIKAKLNINEINLQQQLDAPFLLSQTPGSVAEFFNRIAKLDAIDRGTQNVNSGIREIKQNIEHSNKDLEKKQEEIKQYDYLDKFEIDVEVLEDMDKQCRPLQLGINKLESIIGEIAHYEHQIKIKGQILKLEPLLIKVEGFIQEKKIIETRRDKLAKTLKEIDFVNSQLKNESKILKAEKTVNNLLNLFEDKTSLSKSIKALSNLLENYTTVKESIQIGERNLARAEKTFAQEMPNVCPLCGSVVTKNHKHHENGN